VTLDWTDVPNPQPSGYEAQIAKDSSFSNVEAQLSQLNDSTFTVLSLTPGTKFWRVRSHQGDSSPTTAAVTAWSAVRSFTISAAPPTVQSVTLTRTSAFSGDDEVGSLQLSGPAPSGGATVTLAATNAGAAPVPATVTVPGGFAFAQFGFRYGQVTAATPVTVTATLGSSSASVPVTVQPPSLRDLTLTPSTMTGGATAGAVLMLNGRAPAGGALVSLASSSPQVAVPATVTVAPGDASVSFAVPTSAVSANTTATVTATWQGRSVQAPITLIPQQAPGTLTLDPATTTGTNGSSGTVTLASPAQSDVQIMLQSSNPAVASVPPFVTVPQFAGGGGFFISTSAVSAPTTVTISATGAGVTKTATLTVNPFPTAPPAAPSQLAPAANARFSPGQTVTFDWSDVPGAASYTIQVSTSSAFSSTVVNQTVASSQFATSTLPRANLVWRVRANDAGGNPGAWSPTRAFRVN
jgi:hypothetical protein